MAPRRPLKLAFVAGDGPALAGIALPLMREARARGHTAVGFCSEGPQLAAIAAEGFATQAVALPQGLSPLGFGRPLRALGAAFAAGGFDLVHGFGSPAGLLARLAGRRAGVRRLAYTSLGFAFEGPGSFWQHRLALMLERRAGLVTDLFLTASEAEAEAARQHGLHRRPLAVGLGADPALFRPDPAARARWRAELGVAEGGVAVLAAAGRLSAAQGIADLLRAMEQLPGVELWLAGEAADLGGASARIEARLGARLRRLGPVADMAGLMAAADIFACPTHEPGLPLPAIEAMMAGLPLVGSEAGGLAELIEDGRTGYRTPTHVAEPLAGALGVLARDAGLRARMGEAGRARAAARYEAGRVTRRVLDALGV